VIETAPRRPPKWLRYANRLNVAMLRKGFGPGPQRVLTVAGRTSGVARSTPVAVVAMNGQRFLVAGYETSDWVKNVRAARGAAVIRRGKSSEAVTLIEIPVDQSRVILREFARRVRGGRSFLSVKAGASETEVVAAAPRHPVFRLDPPVSGSQPSCRTDARPC
jgi:hypothetical protein